MSFWSRLFKGEPQRPRIVAHAAFDGAIRVLEVPVSEGWTHEEAAREGDGFVVMVLKYILAGEPMPLALLAKVYTLAAGRTPPADPSSTDWRDVFRPLFEGDPTLDVRAARQLTMKGELVAAEANLVGTAKDPSAPLCIRERRAVSGQEEFIVTAMGPPGAFEVHRAEIDAWFDTAAFEPMADADARTR